MRCTIAREKIIRLPPGGTAYHALTQDQLAHARETQAMLREHAPSVNLSAGS
jgi:hypothetical protein